MFLIVCAALAILSVFLGLGSSAEIVIKIVKVAGGGSLIKGIVMAPLFVFGVVQIFRGLCAIIQSDTEKMSASGESLWHYLYIPATIAGCVAVILAICHWCTAL